MAFLLPAGIAALRTTKAYYSRSFESTNSAMVLVDLMNPVLPRLSRSSIQVPDIHVGLSTKASTIYLESHNRMVRAIQRKI